MRSTLSAAALANAMLPLLAACSTLPRSTRPPFEEREVVAAYDFDGTPPARIEVPASRPGLTVEMLTSEPPGLTESFAAGKRYLAPKSRRLQLRCRYRAYGSDRGRIPSPESLFPQAHAVHTVEYRSGG